MWRRYTGIISDLPSPVLKSDINRLFVDFLGYRDGLQVIRRFTGGGTVIVDQDTVFCSLACNVIH